MCLKLPFFYPNSLFAAAAHIYFLQVYMKNMLENNKQKKSQAKRVKIRTGKIINQGAIDKNPFLRNCIWKRTDVKEGDSASTLRVKGAGGWLCGG